jgi:hypothetical protein
VAEFKPEMMDRFKDRTITGRTQCITTNYVVGPRIDTYVDLSGMDFAEIESRILCHMKGSQRAK